MVVHPAKGHWEGTLASALAHHFGTLSGRGGPTRPGIVHRLDRDTSGVIVVAKNDQAHDALAAQFKAREVEKEYLAIVVGVPELDRDRIDEPIGDHPTHREKKAIRRSDPEARSAVTEYEVVERFVGFALVRARPKTGRTHQIRLHLAHIRHPVLCDRLYGGRVRNHRVGIDSARQNRPGYAQSRTAGAAARAAGTARPPTGVKSPDDRRADGVRRPAAGRHGANTGGAAPLACPLKKEIQKSSAEAQEGEGERRLSIEIAQLLCDRLHLCAKFALFLFLSGAKT